MPTATLKGFRREVETINLVRMVRLYRPLSTPENPEQTGAGEPILRLDGANSRVLCDFVFQRVRFTQGATGVAQAGTRSYNVDWLSGANGWFSSITLTSGVQTGAYLFDAPFPGNDMPARKASGNSWAFEGLVAAGGATFDDPLNTYSGGSIGVNLAGTGAYRFDAQLPSNATVHDWLFLAHPI